MCKTYKTAYGNSVAKVSGLTYTIKEMKAYEAELISRLKDAQIDGSRAVRYPSRNTDYNT